MRTWTWLAAGMGGEGGDRLEVADQAADVLAVRPAPADVGVADDDPAGLRVDRRPVDLVEAEAGLSAEVERPVGHVEHLAVRRVALVSGDPGAGVAVGGEAARGPAPIALAVGRTTSSATSTSGPDGRAGPEPLLGPAEPAAVDDDRPHQPGEAVGGGQQQEHRRDQRVPDRAIAPRGVQPDQARARGDQDDPREQPDPRPRRHGRATDQAEHASGRSGDRHRAPDRLEHPRVAMPVGLEASSGPGGKGRSRSSAVGADGGAVPISRAIAGLVPIPPLIATYGPDQQAGPSTRNADRRPPPRPVDPRRPVQRQERPAWPPAPAAGAAPRAGPGRPARAKPIVSGSQTNRPSRRNRTAAQRPQVQNSRNVLSLRTLTTT